jgi:AraC-like DNA-binding protein
VAAHWDDPDLRLSQVAVYAGLSPIHFGRVFRRVTGERLTQFVLRRRVTEAKRQMTQPDRTITDIAFACGFGSLTHFNRVFHRFERCSPSKWRAQQQHRKDSSYRMGSI